jgi:uncharacterized protein (TIGR00297 family)
VTLRWLTPDGSVAAAAVGGLVLWGAGLRGAVLLLLFFVSGSLLTSFNQRQKPQGRQMRQDSRESADPSPAAAAPPTSPARNARQVLANGGWAAVGATAIRWRPEIGWALLVGSLATAQADTWATEIGAHARGTPRLITTGRPVAVGTSGGVTWLGTGAGVAGAVVLAGTGWLLGLPLAVATPGAVVGVLGMLLDSELGATLEARSWLDNDGVNLAATSAGAVAAAVVTGLLST